LSNNFLSVDCLVGESDLLLSSWRSQSFVFGRQWIFFTGNWQLTTGNFFQRLSIKAVKRSTVSTGNLRAFRLVQLRPINRVVYSGSLGSKLPWNPRLGIGFTLRCFQREARVLHLSLRYSSLWLMHLYAFRVHELQLPASRFPKTQPAQSRPKGHKPTSLNGDCLRHHN
jgi:hypothetical protein